MERPLNWPPRLLPRSSTMKVCRNNSNRQVRWMFKVERAPWWDGFFERLNKLAKMLEEGC